MRTLLALSLLLAGCLWEEGAKVRDSAERSLVNAAKAVITYTQAADTQAQCADPHHEQWRHCQLVKNGNCYACCRYCGGCWTEADGSERCAP